MKRITQILLVFILVFSVNLSLVGASDALSLTSNTAEASGVFKSSDSIDTSKANQYSEATKIINQIKAGANVFAAIVLTISIIMIIVGGLRYILANGNQQQAEDGKKILLYSGIGIVIALSAFALGRLFASFSF